jgi:hypothetical protein
LGIQFAGGAIGQALRDTTPAIVMAASVFIMIANLARSYIWWQALRVKPKKPVSLSSDSPK